MKKIILFTLLITSCNLMFSQTQRVKTKNGKEVILYPNGTWKYNNTSYLNEITKESSQSYFLLKKTYTKKGRNFIVVDFIGEDGSNKNPKLRTFLVDENFGKSNDYCGPLPPTSFYKTFESLKELTDSTYSPPMYLVVKNGIVKCLEVSQAN